MSNFFGAGYLINHNIRVFLDEEKQESPQQKIILNYIHWCHCNDVSATFLGYQMCTEEEIDKKFNLYV